MGSAIIKIWWRTDSGMTWEVWNLHDACLQKREKWESYCLVTSRRVLAVRHVDWQILKCCTAIAPTYVFCEAQTGSLHFSDCCYCWLKVGWVRLVPSAKVSGRHSFYKLYWAWSAREVGSKGQEVMVGFEFNKSPGVWETTKPYTWTAASKDHGSLRVNQQYKRITLDHLLCSFCIESGGLTLRYVWSWAASTTRAVASLSPITAAICLELDLWARLSKVWSKLDWEACLGPWAFLTWSNFGVATSEGLVKVPFWGFGTSPPMWCWEIIFPMVGWSLNFTALAFEWFE